MSEIEFQTWIEFYKDFPFDDVHRYYKPAAMVAAVHNRNFEDNMDFLQPVQIPDGMTTADYSVLKTLGGLRENS